jgi:hypothetical protein
MLPIEPMRWDSPDGVSCWVEEHTVIPRKFVHHGSGSVAGQKHQVEVDDKQEGGMQDQTPPAKKRDAGEDKDEDKRQGLQKDDQDTSPLSGGEGAPDDLSRGGEVGLDYFKQPLE